MSDMYDDTSLYARNKLGMVNTCLMGVGQRPFVEGTLLESLPLGSDGQVAKDIVANALREVCVRGWYFNIDKNFKFVPDSNGYIVAPPNLLRIDVGQTVNRGKYILKGMKFYNRETQSYLFTEPVFADAVWLVDYEALPFTAYQYIALRAARQFQQKVIGSKELYEFTGLEEQDALTNLQREQLQYEDYNMVDSRVVNRRQNPYWGQ